MNIFLFFKVDDIQGPEALNFPGKRDGMTKMIREGNAISVHSWSQGKLAKTDEKCTPEPRYHLY